MGETHLMGITYTREGAGAREYIPYSERGVFFCVFCLGGRALEQASGGHLPTHWGGFVLWGWAWLGNSM